MQHAKVIFHNNCTTAIEGYFGGLRNIFNYSNNLSDGTSEEFKSFLKPLGVQNSISEAKDLVSLNEENYLNEYSELINSNKNLYVFLGEKMSKNKSQKSIDYKFIKKLENHYFTNFSVKDRWKDAEKRIEFIKKNNTSFDKLFIKVIGKVGVEVGSLHE